MNQIMLKALSVKMPEIRALKILSDGCISYISNGIRLYSVLDFNKKNTSQMDYLEAVIRKEIGDYGYLSAVKITNEHVEYIVGAIEVANEYVLNTYRTRDNEVEVKEIVNWQLQRLRDIKKRGISFSEAYGFCHENFEEALEKYMEDAIVKKQEEAETMKILLDKRLKEMSEMKNLNEEFEKLEDGIVDYVLGEIK